MAWEGVGSNVQRALRAKAAWSHLPLECFHRRQGGTTSPAGNHVCGSKAQLTIDGAVLLNGVPREEQARRSLPLSWRAQNL